MLSFYRILLLLFFAIALFSGCVPSDFKIAAPTANSSIASPSTAFSHNNVAITNCSQCHESNRPNNHKINPVNSNMTTADCKQCHSSTVAWSGAAQLHAHKATDTNCINCHNGKTATGKPISHTLNGQCSACHSQAGWTTNSYNSKYVHTNSIIPVSNGNSHPNINNCIMCHNAKSDSINWLYDSTSNQATIIPKGTCAGCHQDSYNRAHGTLTSSSRANCLSCHHTGYVGFTPAN